MIAGLRKDSLSREMAGERGVAIANRMSLTTPQLPDLVEARTRHLEGCLSVAKPAFEQVLVIGVGLDTKPIHFSSPEQPWFGLDRKEMLKARRARLENLPCEARAFTEVAADLKDDDWEAKLLASGLDPRRRTLAIVEGISMYFEEGFVRALLERLGNLLASPADAFELDVPEVQSFFSSMARLGEPFVHAFEDASHLATPAWTTIECVSASDVLSREDDVLSRYLFSLLQRRADSGAPSTP
jgi:methyltransferase (TIGR00027 family)